MRLPRTDGGLRVSTCSGRSIVVIAVLRACLIGCVLSAVAQAQSDTSKPVVLQGWVLAASSALPISSVEIFVSGQLQPQRTDSMGRFVAIVPRARSIQVVARRIGFDSGFVKLDINDSDTTTFVIRLVAMPAVLDTIAVRGSNRAGHPGLRDFEERRRIGIGSFVPDTMIRRMETATSLLNLLRRLGVKIERDRAGRQIPVARARGPSRMSILSCPMQVYVDGVPMVEDDRGFDLRDVRLEQLAAIEFYSGGSQTPVVFEKLNSACGVLVFWMR